MEARYVSEMREYIHELIRQMGFLQKEGAECCGVSFVQSHVIHEIYKHPGISVNDLAGNLGLDKSTMSRHVKGLMKNGYVSSICSDEDRRYLILNLTELGEKLEYDLSQQMTNYLEKLFDQIPEPKQAQLIESIQMLTTVVGKIARCCST